MSERTTIGGTVYEAIGSSSSNLLLKCNGTARIQWGSKLIDLIKNGKIASDNSLELIFIVLDESEIKSDGVYVLTAEETNHLLIYKDGNKYDLTGKDLYISASKPLNLTVEQKRLALDNIGMHYNTLEEAQKAGIKNGIIYIIDTKKLYTIKEGVIEEFEATLKTVTVEKENNNSDVINGSVKLVLSVLDDEYLILADLRITANYSIHVKNSAQLGSESADKTHGYRLYIDGDTSYLDVDEINVRNGIKISLYKEVTFDELTSLITFKKLIPKEWYLITDYLNPWKLSVYNAKFNRPILVRAFNEELLYKKGYLFNNYSVEIEYDINYQEPITQIKDLDGVILTEVITTRGKITWMKDNKYNNLANFDFLDYIDANEIPLTTLHFPDENLKQDKSIFPKFSKNNTLIVYNLKGTVIKNLSIDNTNTCSVNFQIDDSENSLIEMHDNYIECCGITVTSNCYKFHNNLLKKSALVVINANFYNNEFNTLYNSYNLNDLVVSEFINLEHFIPVEFNNKFSDIKCLESKHNIFNTELHKCLFNKIEKTQFNAQLSNVLFKNIKSCVFNEGIIRNVQCFCDLDSTEFNSDDLYLLYTDKLKEIYLNGNKLEIICIPEQIFYRGMIIMHSGIEVIPQGWALCDGLEYEWNGVKSKTPDLRNRFIKATESLNSSEVKASDPNEDLDANGKLVLRDDLLPLHNHPHQQHSHTFSGNGYMESSTSFYALTEASPVEAITSVEGGSSDYSGDDTSGETINVNVSGNVYISGTTSSEYSYENTTTVFKNNPINIEPNYYSLIFIMKL